MLRIADKTNENFSQCFGLTKLEDIKLRYKLLSTMIEADETRSSDVLKKTLDEISNEIDPSFELVAVASYILGGYAERARHPETQMLLLMEHAYLESVLQG